MYIFILQKAFQFRSDVIVSVCIQWMNECARTRTGEYSWELNLFDAISNETINLNAPKWFWGCKIGQAFRASSLLLLHKFENNSKQLLDCNNYCHFMRIKNALERERKKSKIEKKENSEAEMLFVTKRRRAIFRPCRMTLIPAQPTNLKNREKRTANLQKSRNQNPIHYLRLCKSNVCGTVILHFISHL